MLCRFIIRVTNKCTCEVCIDTSNSIVPYNVFMQYLMIRFYSYSWCLEFILVLWNLFEMINSMEILQLFLMIFMQAHECHWFRGLWAIYKKLCCYYISSFIRLNNCCWISFVNSVATGRCSGSFKSVISEQKLHTVRCHSNPAKFLQNHHNRHPIAHRYWYQNRYEMVHFTKEIMMLLGASLAVMWFPSWLYLFNMHFSVQCTRCRWPEGMQSEKSSLAIMCCTKRYNLDTGMGWLLWVWSLIYILLLSSHCCRQYWDKLEHVFTIFLLIQYQTTTKHINGPFY